MEITLPILYRLFVAGRAVGGSKIGKKAKYLMKSARTKAKRDRRKARMAVVGPQNVTFPKM